MIDWKPPSNPAVISFSEGRELAEEIADIVANGGEIEWWDDSVRREVCVRCLNFCLPILDRTHWGQGVKVGASRIFQEVVTTEGGNSC